MNPTGIVMQSLNMTVTCILLAVWMPVQFHLMMFCMQKLMYRLMPRKPTATPGNQEITLNWNSSAEDDFLHYNIYGGTLRILPIF